MAWYTIKGTCGHNYQKQLYGKGTSRQSYIEYAERTMVCPDCYKAQLEAERAKASQAAAQEAQADNLPTLEGSPKQIAWAETLRKTKLDAYRELAGKCAIHGDNEPVSQGSKVTVRMVIEKITKRVNALKKETSAKYYIDRRYNDVSISSIVETIEADLAKEAGKNLVG